MLERAPNDPADEHPGAQSPTPETGTAPEEPDPLAEPDESPDVFLDVPSLVPRTRAALSGDPDHDSTSGSDRDGLPAAVSPSVTYRDARVDYRIIARLRAKPDPRAAES